MLRPAHVLTFGLASLLAHGASLPAQELPQARQFFFDNYANVMQLDFAALRDRGIWEDIELSMIKVVLGLAEKELGFPLSRLDRLTSVVDFGFADGEMIRRHELDIYEGNAELSASDGMRGSRYQQEEFGDFVLLRDRWMADQACVQVGPNLRVKGHVAAIEPVLTGKPRSGLPCADVMSLVAVRGLLGYVVFDVSLATPPAAALREALPDAEWPADDRPTFVCIRVRATGDEDDPHLLLEAVVRHGTVGDGLAATEAAVTRALARVVAMPEVRLFKRLLKQVEHERAGTDAIWRVDLGRSRSAVGLFATAAVPYLMLARVVGEDLVEVEAEPPAREKPPAPNKKR